MCGSESDIFQEEDWKKDIKRVEQRGLWIVFDDFSRWVFGDRSRRFLQRG